MALLEVYHLGPEVRWCGAGLGLSTRLHLGDAATSILLVHGRIRLVMGLVQEALGEQDLWRLRLRTLVVVDLGVPTHWRVD